MHESPLMAYGALTGRHCECGQRHSAAAGWVPVDEALAVSHRCKAS